MINGLEVILNAGDSVIVCMCTLCSLSQLYRKADYFQCDGTIVLLKAINARQLGHAVRLSMHKA